MKRNPRACLKRLKSAYLCKMDYAVELRYQALKKQLETDFGGGMDVQAILFLIGVQELGLGHKTYTKREKTELLHVAICTILEPYGYYRFEGRDEENWPHFELIRELPSLSHNEQQHLMKEALIEYFAAEGYFDPSEIKP